MLRETIDYKGCTIEVHSDDDPESPRTWSNFGTMTCRHRDYHLGDVHDQSAEDIIELTKRDDVLWLPLYLLDHSGLWMKTGTPDADTWTTRGDRFVCDSQGWDTSTVGIIYATFETIRKEYNVKKITPAVKKKAYALLECEVKTYSDYLEGAVCGYMTKDENDEHLDSCWGYYPEHEQGREDYHYMMEEARSSIDHHLEQKAKAQAEQNANDQQALQLL